MDVRCPNEIYIYKKKKKTNRKKKSAKHAKKGERGKKRHEEKNNNEQPSCSKAPLIASGGDRSSSLREERSSNASPLAGLLPGGEDERGGEAEVVSEEPFLTGRRRHPAGSNQNYSLRARVATPFADLAKISTPTTPFA